MFQGAKWYALSPSGIVRWDYSAKKYVPADFSVMKLRARKKAAIQVLWSTIDPDMRKFIMRNALLWSVFVMAILDIAIQRESYHNFERPVRGDWIDGDHWFAAGYHIPFARLFGLDTFMIREILELAECSPWAWRIRP